MVECLKVRVNSFAKKHGFSLANKIHVEYKDYEVISAKFARKDRAIAKHPLYVLANENEIRFSTIEEWGEINEIRSQHPIKNWQENSKLRKKQMLMAQNV